MLNSSGIKTEELGARRQILANVEHQYSIGCVVAQAVGVAVGNRRIAKAGTPIRIDLQNTATAAVLATASVAMVGVLLHDVDVTNGNNNGTALLFGFVNLNHVDADVQALIATAVGSANASKLVTFLKV
jgi:hypothetical protein